MGAVVSEQELPELTSEEQALIHEIENSTSINSNTVSRYLLFLQERRKLTDMIIDVKLKVARGAVRQ